MDGRLYGKPATTPTGTPGATVVLADDDVLLREGLAALLTRAGYHVGGQAANPSDLLALVHTLAPDLAVIDIRMPPTHTTEGIEAARAIRAAQPEVALLLLSAHVEVDHALEILGTGERVGYLLKSRVSDVAEFLGALDRIRSGGAVIDQLIVEELIDHPRRSDPLASLSQREREVLAFMAEGRSNAGIAHLLSLSASAVEKHVRNILAKLELPASAEDHRRVLAVLRYLESA